ncbi:16S rRNA (adenine(1518)-N(6)/adenine(1519)-N(6))-dimethyltransferase RsmA [Alicyclobacillus sp. TC]|uniref:Ribosomal RNA small subunit methyltransferase A n=1 Tax=Alicyclobacillus tolerans TaxID=90970 RepID=A0A1M6PIE9_9BACL|nr:MULTISPECIES: 16S rRNA (adenine(1518)-N(6)/adenine(1519)-N(6))-dimethyltransferase RsmA [Alicyclobacillus]QRF22340.1 16S rRNA (adenine(1518)-N(6)/adenine(1519)-N(6))-dimethyltransferase RsmA [Alicyclobacillus sp. TC]SHK07712.1 dimethyladenosine transferase [Alicyclobacillus montanus]
MKPDITRPSVLRELLGRHGFTLKKQLGQNFLIDSHALDSIVDAADIHADTSVIEIGPGAGVLTTRLAERAARVLAVEKDDSLRPVLEEVLSGTDNVTLLFADALEVSLEDWVGQHWGEVKRLVVAANLPYYITTPLLFHILESNLPVSDMVILVQKEVADRLLAKPGGKDYGVLTVMAQWRAEVQRVVNVSANCFLPPPTVESSVVRLAVRSQPPYPLQREAALRKVVRAAFGMRRKTLDNALAGGLSLSKSAVTHLLACAQIDGKRRGETLDLQEFARLANAFVENGVQ